MKRVNFNAFSHLNGKYLHEGDCFEKALLLQFLRRSRQDGSIGIEKVSAKVSLNEQHPQDTLHTLFHDECAIDPVFAEKLSIFDVILPGCFKAKTPIGKEILGIVAGACLVFILNKRTWVEPGRLWLGFEAAHEDYDEQYLTALIGGDKSLSI